MTDGRPIEIGGADVFEFRLGYPAPRRDSMEHRHMAKKASDVKNEDVPPEDLEALIWVRQKRGVIEFGRPYTIQKFSEALQTTYKEEVPARSVTVEIPTFAFGARGMSSQGRATGRGVTLREAVENTKQAIRWADPEDTYPARDALLDNVITKIGSCEFRVAHLCQLIRDYYEDDHGTGGTLHCALDDGNMDDLGIDWEIEHAKEAGDKEALLIAELLRLMPEADRKKLYERGYAR